MNPCRITLLAAAIFFLCWSLPACSPPADPPSDAPSEPAADSTGNDQSPEPRLVILSPAIAVIAQDVGLEDTIVGRHDFDITLSESIPKVGDQTAIDYEALLATNPTHVILQWGERDLPPRLTELAEQRGFALIDYQLLTLDDIAGVADDLYLDFVSPPGNVGFQPDGDADITPTFISPERAFDRSLPSQRMARAWRRREPGFESLGRVLLLGSVDPPAVLGPGSFHHQILEHIGATPALTEGSPWTELDAEDVLRLAPDAIVLVAPRTYGTPPHEFTDAEIRERLGRLAELKVPAVNNARLAILDDPLALLPSTSMIRFADHLATTLEHWRNEPRP